MLLFNIVKNFTKKIDRLINGEAVKEVSADPVAIEEVAVTEKKVIPIVAVPIKAKSSLEITLDKLKAIYVKTRKFRIKKKLDNRIGKLENEKLVQVRMM